MTWANVMSQMVNDDIPGEQIFREIKELFV
jgi:hypothetical protein